MTDATTELMKLEAVDSHSQFTKTKSQESDDVSMSGAPTGSPRLARVNTGTEINMQTHTKRDSKKRKRGSSKMSDFDKSTLDHVPQSSNELDINMVDIIRRKASHVHTQPRVDNSMLFSKMPKLQDMAFDDNTRVTTVLHCFLTALSIVLFILGCLGIELSLYVLGVIAIVSNAFGILHSMYSGSETSKAHRLDHAIQNLAQVIAKFARALDIQESHLDSVRMLLDYFYLSMNQLENQNKAISSIKENNNNKNDNDNDNDGKVKVSDKIKERQMEQAIESKFNSKKFYFEMMHQINLQHKAWLVSLFRQFRLLDNRFGITKEEYDEFISKLPLKTRKLFDQLQHGIENRFKVIMAHDPESYTHRMSRRRLSKLEEEIDNVTKKSSSASKKGSSASQAGYSAVTTKGDYSQANSGGSSAAGSRKNTKGDATDGTPLAGDPNYENELITSPGGYSNMASVSAVGSDEHEEHAEYVDDLKMMDDDNDNGNGKGNSNVGPRFADLKDQGEWKSKVLFYTDLEHIVNKVITDLFEKFS